MNSQVTVSIRPALSNDASQLSEVAFRSKAYWPYDDSFLEMCKDDLTISPERAASGFVLVAELEGRIVGFYSFDSSTNPPEMNNLFVSPDLIGRGVGFQLWNHAIEFARSKGWNHFVMDADPYAAEKFYYKVGCYKIGEVESTVLKGRFIPKLRFDIPEFGRSATTIEIRVATENDVPGIRRAIRSSIEGLAAKDYPDDIIQSWGADTPKAQEKQKAAIREGKELTWVAVQNEKIVGFSAFSPETEELRAVYVAAEVARRGVGTKLLKYVEKHARELGLSSLKMHSSITAAPFYTYHGYSTLGEITHTLTTGAKMTAVEMRKRLV